MDHQLEELLNINTDQSIVIDHDAIKKAIIISQHTQRNWNLSKNISEKNMDLLIHSATQCPSKQNIAYYKTHFITNRDIIEQIHAVTTFKSQLKGEYERMTNPQVLANLLIVFEKHDFIPSLKDDIFRSNETEAIINGSQTSDNMRALQRDAEMAVGIAAGYLNLTASIIGLRTGCCACFDTNEVKNILSLENEPLLLMGIGYKGKEMNRRVHHKIPDVVFSSKTKQPIQVQFYK